MEVQQRLLLRKDDQKLKGCVGMFKIAAFSGDWLYALFMGAVIYFGFSIYKWWKNEGKKKWKKLEDKLFK